MGVQERVISAWQRHLQKPEERDSRIHTSASYFRAHGANGPRNTKCNGLRIHSVSSSFAFLPQGLGVEPWRSTAPCNLLCSFTKDNGSSLAFEGAAGLQGGLSIPELSLESVCVSDLAGGWGWAPQLPNYSPSPRIWNKVIVPGRPQVKAPLPHLPFNSPRRLLFLI